MHRCIETLCGMTQVWAASSASSAAAAAAAASPGKRLGSPRAGISPPACPSPGPIQNNKQHATFSFCIIAYAAKENVEGCPRYCGVQIRWCRSVPWFCQEVSRETFKSLCRIEGFKLMLKACGPGSVFCLVVRDRPSVLKSREKSIDPSLLAFFACNLCEQECFCKRYAQHVVHSCLQMGGVGAGPARPPVFCGCKPASKSVVPSPCRQRSKTPSAESPKRCSYYHHAWKTRLQEHFQEVCPISDA